MMTKLLLIVSFSVTTILSYGDAGNCVQYRVRVTTKNNIVFEGHTTINSYVTKFTFKESTFLDYLKNIGRDSIHIYKNIHQLEFPILEGGRPDCPIRLKACPIDEIIKLSVSEIKNVTVLSYTTCNSCDSKDEKDGFYWNGIFPNVITELTLDEIKLLQKAPASQSTFGFGNESTSSYWLLSYNQKYSQKQLDLISSDFQKITDDVAHGNKSINVHTMLQELKNKLRMEKVVMIQIGNAP